MKRFYEILLFSLIFFISCSQNDYRKYMEKGEYEKALKIAEEKFKTNPEKKVLADIIYLSDEKLYDTKRAVLHTKRYENIRGDFSGIENIVGTLFYNYSLSFYKKGENDSSEYYLKKAEHFSPENYKICLLFGKLYVKRNDFENAKKFLLKSIELEGNNIESYKFLGNIEFLQGNFEKAKNYYEKGISVDSSDCQLLMNYAELNMKTKNEKNGIEIIKKVISIDSTYFDAYDRLVKYYYKVGLTDSIFKYLNLYENIAKRKTKEK
ncbi:MAG: hypothetical protein QME48_01000 [bacterium]|nr:MAG: TPR repeat-containing protein [candidate division TA06 bacterium 32_111]KUK87667.1 MAG: TPR repeat-containing protein [candidate division TA06 bacterium 34_109]MDI6699801.1 hypothetical protein [bacterium]